MYSVTLNGKLQEHNTISDFKQVLADNLLTQAIDKLSGGGASALSTAGSSVTEVATQAKDMMTTIKGFTPYIKPVGIGLGVVLGTLWLTDIYLNIREIMNK